MGNVIAGVTIHEGNLNVFPPDEGYSVWVEYEPERRKYVVVYSGCNEYDTEEYDDEGDAIRTMLEWAENVVENLSTTDWYDPEEQLEAWVQIVQVSMEYGRLGSVQHYTHGAPEGEIVSQCGSLSIYRDDRGGEVKYHLYYEDGLGGESYEGLWSLESAAVWALAILRNTGDPDGCEEYFRRLAAGEEADEEGGD